MTILFSGRGSRNVLTESHGREHIRRLGPLVQPAEALKGYNVKSCLQRAQNNMDELTQIRPSDRSKPALLFLVLEE